MEDPLWQSLDACSKGMQREQLELVIQKKKLSEVFDWFHNHFVKSSTPEYISRCPIVILQGPTGCGKTSTLKWISNELKIPIKEYSETTDITAINYDLARTSSLNGEEDRAKLSQSIDRRKAQKFEHFVIDTIRYNALYPINENLSAPDAESEFDSDDGFVEMVSKPIPKPPITGTIIHVDTPLIFARSQRVLIQSLHRLIKVISEISRHLLRRVAIVFETLEGESETISLPIKIKLALRIQVFKFNPIIKTNMKKLVDFLIKPYKNLILDKETVEQLVTDCDGDMRACINTLQLICNKSTGAHVLSRPNYRSTNGFDKSPFKHIQANKKQKLIHEKVRQIKLNSSLMRDNTRSLCFFHILGKIFYQKRLYPDRNSSPTHLSLHRYRSIDRPYLTENSTEDLACMVDVEPRNLINWLHHHYYRFCRESNIDKASLFLENLSITDTTSISSTQSSQFYEMRHALDRLQIHLSIESTVYSLYEDQSSTTKPSHKKTCTDRGNKFIIKSSVENSTSSNELYSFNKPTSMNLPRLVEDYETLLNCCITKMNEISTKCDPNKVLLDYIPYVNRLSANWLSMSPGSKTKFYPTATDEPAHQLIYQDADFQKIISTLDEMADKQELDLEVRHEKLLDMIEDIETRQTKTIVNMI